MSTVSAGSRAVFFVLSVAFGLVSAGNGAAQRALDLRWSHEGPNWLPTTVSLGDHGAQVFTALGSFTHASKLFSSGDDDPAQPVWTSADPDYVLYARVASALESDVHAKLSYQTPDLGQSPQAVVERFGSSSSLPHWSFTFPFPANTSLGGVAVSDAGSTILAWTWKAASYQVALAVFDAGSPVPRQYLLLGIWGQPVAAVLSGDGSTFYISSASRAFVLDTVSGEILHEHANIYTATVGRAISHDGRRFAQSLLGGSVRVFERQGSVYGEVFHYLSPTPSWCRRLAMSVDGWRVAAAFDQTDTLLDVRLVLFDLRAHPETMLLDETISGQGQYDNATSNVELSRDGRTLALGLWGDEAGLAPEINVYRQGAESWTRLDDWDLPGSVLDMALSPDGSALVVASKTTHNNVFATGGTIDLFRIAGRDLVLVGVPSIGNAVELEHRLEPGALSRTVFAGALNEPPLPFPGVGMLYLDRQDLHVFASGTADENGVARTRYTIRDDPALIGTTVYFQSLQAFPRRLSRDWIKMTILP